MTGNQIDKAWFSQHLKKNGRSQNDLARFLNLHRSAVTRMLNGERNMSVEEQDRIAEYLDVPVSEVSLHRRGEPSGFSEPGQTAYAGPARVNSMTEETWTETKRTARHPVFGCMKGTMTIPTDLDLTAPIDVEWSETLYNE